MKGLRPYGLQQQPNSAPPLWGRRKKLMNACQVLNALMDEDEVLEWYSLSPVERFEESLKLWEVFALFGGDYDPEPDSQSPFHIFET
jgi:hypothetical protein